MNCSRRELLESAGLVRYPAASYYAYFPTKSGYPVRPELKTDIMRQTVDLCREEGLKTVAYVPLNRPCMHAACKDPRFPGWNKKLADSRPITTEHYGFAEYFEGCLNSQVLLPISDVKGRIRIPRRRSVDAAVLLRVQKTPPSTVRDGWLDVTVPGVFIHETVRVDLA
jgi:hypothetical protein